MKIFVLSLLVVLAVVQADVSYNNGYNTQLQQAYFYKNPSSLVLPKFITTQLPYPQHPIQQYPLVNRNLPLQNPTVHAANLPQILPMPFDFPGEKYLKVKSAKRPRPRVKIPKKPIVTKSFYVHTAPEDTDEEIQAELKQLQQQPRKHYNVLFVKSPAQTSKTAAVNLAKALKEEKTVVYVLAKKTTASDLRDAIAESPQQINKPDVFFIKYRTPEEAENAQRQIQSQYDSLGGTSTITDEGLAPITSVVGSLDSSSEESDEDHESDTKSSQSPAQELIEHVGQPYLPPNRK